jgi:hypothetical protein
VVVALCKFCRQPFEYEAKRALRLGKDHGSPSHRVCDDCRAGRKRFIRRVEKAKERAERLWVEEVEASVLDEGDTLYQHARGLTHEEVAARLGLSVMQVRLAEARAMKKLQSSPELRGAYDSFIEAGMSLSMIDLGDVLWQAREKQINEYQREVIEWTQILDAAANLDGMGREVERARTAVERCRVGLLRHTGLISSGRDWTPRSQRKKHESKNERT